MILSFPSLHIGERVVAAVDADEGVVGGTVEIGLAGVNTTACGGLRAGLGVVTEEEDEEDGVVGIVAGVEAGEGGSAKVEGRED